MVNLLSILYLCTSLALSEENPMAKRPVDTIQFKPGKGLEITSADGDFSLTTRLRAQVLYSLAQEEEWSHGLQLRRARLLFQGHAFGKHNKYKFELAVSPRDIGLKSGTIARSPLLDWYFTFDHIRDLSFQIGQFKVPYSRQRVVSSADMQMVDRSLVNGEFNLDRDIGANIQSKDLLGMNMFRYSLGVYMGEGHSSYANGDFGMMYLGRVEVLPLGLFSDYSESSFRKETTPKISLGLGYAMLQKAKKNQGILGSTPTDGGTTDTQNLTADICIRYQSLSLESAFFWREGVRDFGDDTPQEDPRNGSGFYVQSGLFVAPTIELVGRYGQILPSSETTSLSDRSEVGFGMNHYIAEHAMKIQGDVHQIKGEDTTEKETLIRLQMQFGY